ncbi:MULTISPECIES: hypothetical protein [unclassified Bacillus (in: firmicutes)]|uniref:hypothetical protein n=1 Tax=unclassified Bacillus (in: firmicutes) TaxID=185979 RepID=UPI0008ECE596|nr:MULTISPECIES: hypothetical protein [unclassified Bacillus (in: firmicutes)]SFA99128.1 hypothetical protein SAMN02799634_103414 [Bacillus sp. UNCCL13]SFQ81454.1 hypothetical protein SAMN04488577_2043 [Bacillus sp. cl95]
MNHSYVDFAKISNALNISREAIESENHFSEDAIRNLMEAQEELKMALSFSSSLK